MVRRGDGREGLAGPCPATLVCGGKSTWPCLRRAPRPPRQRATRCLRPSPPRATGTWRRTGVEVEADCSRGRPECAMPSVCVLRESARVPRRPCQEAWDTHWPTVLQSPTPRGHGLGRPPAEVATAVAAVVATTAQVHCGCSGCRHTAGAPCAGGGRARGGGGGGGGDRPPWLDGADVSFYNGRVYSQ